MVLTDSIFVPVPKRCSPAVLTSCGVQVLKDSCDEKRTVILSYTVEPCGFEPNKTKCLSGVETKTSPTLVGI